MITTQNIVIILILVWLLYSITNKNEGFDKDMTTFVSVGKPRYGLRGEKLRVRPVLDCPLDCYNDCYNSNF